MNILHPIQSLRNRAHQHRLENQLEKGGYSQQPTHHFPEADCYVNGSNLLVNFPKSRNLLEVSGFGEKPQFTEDYYYTEPRTNRDVPLTCLKLTRPDGESLPLPPLIAERPSDELASKALRATLDGSSLLFRSLERSCEIDLAGGTITQIEPKATLQVDSHGHIEPPNLSDTVCTYDKKTSRLIAHDKYEGSSYYFSPLPLNLMRDVTSKTADNSSLPVTKDNSSVRRRFFGSYPCLVPLFGAPLSDVD